MSEAATLVQAFYGRDPLAGEDALIELVKRRGARAIEDVIPLSGAAQGSSTQVAARLKSLAAALGPQVVPHLARAISDGDWWAKTAAATCFAAFDDATEIQTPLIQVLEKGSDFDAERLAIEALGHLGADGWAFDLVQYAANGVWRPGSSLADPDDVSTYPFEKLSSYVLQAITLFVAKCRTRERVASLLRLLTDFIALREKHLPYFGIKSYALVERHTEQFSGWSVDPMLEMWGRSGDDRLRELCLTTLGRIAPLRAARFLLETAMSDQVSIALRTSASIALGELRHPQVAQLLADALRSPSTDRTTLDWAFSTLYAVPIDWSGQSAFVDSVLAQRTEPAAQLAYSLALKGDHRFEQQLIERLDGAAPLERWSAALALARLLGAKSRPLLEQRGEDAADDLERCAMCAAALRAGDSSMAERLHVSLQQLPTLPLLRTVWKVEILESFRVSSGFDARAFPLWKAAAGITPRQVQYYDALTQATTGGTLAPTLERPRGTQASRTKLFISYSHRDSSWLQRFRIMLRPLVDGASLAVWEDTKIGPGKWREQIDSAMAECRIALFLVSANFLGSDFITRVELQELLRNAEARTVMVVWVLLDDCLWEVSPLEAYQGENANQPLTLMSEGEQSRAIKKACLRIRDLLAMA